MINISELKIVEDTFFKSRLEYYKPSIYKLIEKHFNEENEYSEATLVKLKNLPLGSKELALNRILEKDTKVLLSEIETTPKQFDESLWRDMLPRIREEVKKSLGLDFKTRPVNFVPSFPEGLISFELKGASSLTIFEGNEGAGIYFLNKRVSSFFTPIFLIHEQLHSCLSQNKSKEQMYIEWFEEGLCQWYSLKIYYDITKNLDVMRFYRERSHIYSKVKDEHNFTRRYYEYMKIMAALYLNGGEKLIGKLLIDYLSNKRDLINDYLDIDKLMIKKAPKTEFENLLSTFSVAVEPEVLPPVEYIILEEALSPVTLEEITSKTGLPQALITNATVSLHLKGMIVQKGNKVEINWRKKDLFDKGLIKAFWPIKGG